MEQHPGPPPAPAPGRFSAPLESLRARPLPVQAALLLAAAFALCALFWYFVTSPRRAEAAEASARAADLRLRNHKARLVEERVREHRARVEQAEVEHRELLALLPGERELTNILSSAQAMARGLVRVDKFTPRDESAEGFYRVKPVEIEVSGPYNSIGRYFERLATQGRVVSVTDFRMTQAWAGQQQPGPQAGDTRASTRCTFTLKAYYLPEQARQGAEPQQQQRQEAQQQVGPAQAPQPSP